MTAKGNWRQIIISAHNFVTGMSFDAQGSVHDGNHDGVVRIFVGLS